MKAVHAPILPPMWQEALVLWARSQGQNQGPQAPPGWAECQGRLDHMQRVFEDCDRNQETARRRLQGEYGATYFYYYFLQRKE